MQYLEDQPPPSSAYDFLCDYAPGMMKTTMSEAFGYLGPDVNGVLDYRPVSQGEIVKFWDGEVVEDMPFNAQDYWVADFFAMAYRLVSLAEQFGTNPPLILDVGAGTCMQTVALRAVGCDFRVLNLDVFKPALAVGRELIRCFGLRDTHMGSCDVDQTLASAAPKEELRRLILDCAEGRPIIVMSRYSIYPFFSIPSYERLFDFLVEDLDVKAGLHLEMCGHHTPDYKAMSAQVGVDLPAANKTYNEPGDPLICLESWPKVKVHERYGLWPHFITTRFPSFLSWTR